MSKTVSIDALASEIDSIFAEFTELTNVQVQDAVMETANDMAKDISSRASGLFGGTGKYAKSWRAKEDAERITRLNVAAAVVYANANGYRLAHLLEKGHAKRGGGRVAGRPHIAPAEEAAKDTLVEKIKMKLGR